MMGDTAMKPGENTEGMTWNSTRLPTSTPTNLPLMNMNGIRHTNNTVLHGQFNFPHTFIPIKLTVKFSPIY